MSHLNEEQAVRPRRKAKQYVSWLLPVVAAVAVAEHHRVLAWPPGHTRLGQHPLAEMILKEVAVSLVPAEVAVAFPVRNVVAVEAASAPLAVADPAVAWQLRVVVGPAAVACLAGRETGAAEAEILGVTRDAGEAVVASSKAEQSLGGAMVVAA